MKVSVLLLVSIAVFASQASAGAYDPIIIGGAEELRCEEIGGECMSKNDKKICKEMEGEIDPMGKCEGKKDICCVLDFVTMPTGGPIFTGEPEELWCEEIGGECMSKKDKKICQKEMQGEIDPMGKCEGKKDICCVIGFATGKPEELWCEEIGGECMSKKDKKKCKKLEGEIDPMGKCEGKKDICCVTGFATGKPEELWCEEIGGECMSKKDKKKCKKMEGELDPMGKCEGKKDICCVLDFVTMPTGGPIITGEPEELWCEVFGGECMSKKDKKKCQKEMQGEIDPMGKCEGKKDICCVTGFATMPTGGPIITGEPIAHPCTGGTGECMTYKECAEEGGEKNSWAKCEDEKDICCSYDFATMPTGGPIFTGEPEQVLCEEINGVCLPKKICKEDEGVIDPMGLCEGKKNICCVLGFATMPTGGPIITGEPEQILCEEIDGVCLPKKICKEDEGVIDPMGICEGKKDKCCILE